MAKRKPKSPAWTRKAGKNPKGGLNGKPTRLLLSLRAWGASSKADAKRKAKAISARNKAKKARSKKK